MANRNQPLRETKIALLHSFSPARTLDGLSSDRQSLAAAPVVTPSSCDVVLLLLLGALGDGHRELIKASHESSLSAVTSMQRKRSCDGPSFVA